MVIEPVASGIPVIATNYPPMNEFVRQPEMLTKLQWFKRKAMRTTGSSTRICACPGSRTSPEDRVVRGQRHGADQRREPSHSPKRPSIRQDSDISGHRASARFDSSRRGRDDAGAASPQRCHRRLRRRRRAPSRSGAVGFGRGRRARGRGALRSGAARLAAVAGKFPRAAALTSLDGRAGDPARSRAGRLAGGPACRPQHRAARRRCPRALREADRRERPRTPSA